MSSQPFITQTDKLRADTVDAAAPEHAPRATVSIVVPVYNEQDCVEPLLGEIHAALFGFEHSWEMIIVDDGSTDRTWTRLQAALVDYGDHIQLIRFQRNFGQSAAMQAGIDAARGDLIVTIDGDLQNDPGDIPLLVERLLSDDLDLLSGWRKTRQDALWSRKLPSRLANRLIGSLTGVHLHDYGCTLKVYRASILGHVRLYGEMHRFLPAWMAKFTHPSRIAEHPVKHRARNFGQSKYGISRTIRVLLDLLAVLFFLRYSARPGHAFGTLGLILGSIGGSILAYLLVLKLLGQSIGGRPLLITGVLLVVMAVQFITTGVLSELLARIYYESGRADGNAYIVAQRQRAHSRHPAVDESHRSMVPPDDRGEPPGRSAGNAASLDKQSLRGWCHPEEETGFPTQQREAEGAGE